MSNDLHRVIAFPVGGKRPQTTEVTEHTATASIRSIDSSVRFYWENIDPDLEHAPDFIRILLSTGYVTIYTVGSTHNDYSKLRVSIGDEEPLELYAQDFLKLISRDWRKVSDIAESIERWLSSKNIRIGFREDDSSHEKRILTAEEAEDYHVEDIQVSVGDITYNVDIYFQEGIVIGLSDVDDFDLEKTVSLLDMILTAFDDAESEAFNNLSTEGAGMDITYEESEDVSITTHIPPVLMEKVVYGAILRMDSLLYGTMTPIEARKHYFHHHVIPKLSGIKMN